MPVLPQQLSWHPMGMPSAERNESPQLFKKKKEMNHHSIRTVRPLPWFSFLRQLLRLDLQHMIPS